MNYFKRPDDKAVPKYAGVLYRHRDDSEDEGVYEETTDTHAVGCGNSAVFCGVEEPLTEYCAGNHRTIWSQQQISHIRVTI